MDQSKLETFPTDNDEKTISSNGTAQENSKGGVSDDEGFVSGDEDFDIGQDKDDVPFVDAPATVESLDNIVGNDANLVGEGIEDNDFSDVKAKEGVGSDVGINEVGDSVVDNINDVQVDVANPGVVVVGGETKEKDEVSNDQEGGVGEVSDVVEDKKFVAEGIESKVEEFVEVGEKEEVASDSVDVKLTEEDSVAFGETKESEVVEGSDEVEDVDRNLVVEGKSEVEAKEEVKSDSVDVNLAEKGDSVVETIKDINVDVAAPGVVIVGETKESEVVDDTREVEDVGRNVVVEEEVESKIEESSEVEAKETEVVDEGKKEEFSEAEKEEVTSDAVDAKPTEEGDSVVDTISAIKVDVAAPGVVVVGGTEENDDVENFEGADAGEVAVVEPEPFGVNDVKLTTEEDAIVDGIQVEPVAPGVAVVGEVDKGKVGEVEREVSIESAGDAEDSSKSTEEVAPSTENKFDILERNPEPENVEIGNEKLDAGAVIHSEDVVGVEKSVKKEEMKHEPVIANEASENGVASIVNTDREVEIVDKTAGTDLGLNLPENTNAETILSNGVRSGEAKEVEITDKTVDLGMDIDQLESTDADTIQSNGVHAGEDGEVADKAVDLVDANQPQNTNAGTMQLNGVDSGEEDNPDVSDGDADDLVFGSESAKKFIEELEKESGLDSQTGAGSSLELSQRMDGQIVTDSEEEEGDSDDEEDGKELFDPSALAALLKAATGADSDGGSITITSQDGSRLFSVERPAGMGPTLRALRPAPQQSTRPTLFSPSVLSTGVESEENLSDEEKKKLVKLQQIRVKFLRLVHKLGLSTEEPVAEQVLYRLSLLGGRRNTQSFNLDAAKQMALQLESSDGNNLDFSMNILVLGKSGVGKSATINSIFGDEKASIGAFETGTGSVKVISGYVNGVNINIVDTPGLKSSAMEQGFNRSIFSSVQKLTKKSPPDVVLYVDRLDAQTRDLNDLPMLKTVTSALGPSIWRSVIVTLTHGSSAPPDGPTGNPLSYDVFVSQRSHVVQQSIGHAVGDLRMMSPNLMNPITLAENHPNCRKNRDGQKILPNGQIWRPQLLLLCYSMKILSEASALSKPQDPFDHRKLFGFRTRSPPLPYMLSSMLQSRPHPKLPSDQGDGADSDVDLDDFSDSDGEEDEYDQLPPFKPLKLRQISKLSKEQRKAYFEEYDYRVKLLQKKSWREELKRMREMKKRGKDSVTDYGFNEDDPDSGASAPISVPLPDMALPASFDGDNPAYRYRFLEPTSQFLARPVLDSHGWDHDCGYDGVNLEHSLAIINRFPATYTVQVSKDKKDFTFSLDSSISVKHGDKMSTMAGFDIQSMGKQLAYIFRGETKFKNLRKNKAAAGVTFTVLGENVIPGVKIEDQITLGKQYVLVGSAGAVKSQQETAYGANFELQRRDAEYPIGQVQSTVSMSLVKWRGDLALGLNGLAQFTIGRNSKVAVRAGINNKMSGQVTVRTSSSEHLSLALAAVLPTVLSVYRKLWPAPNEKYGLY